MKNKGLHSLLLITLIFSALLVGFFTGRLSSLHGDSLSVTYEQSAHESISPEQITYHDGKININTSSAEDLMMLPGIGPMLAERIISYRETNGPFSATKELINVKGIGEQTYAKIEQFITAGG